MIYEGSNGVFVSTIKGDVGTAHTLAMLRLSGTEFGDRVTAYLTFHKVRGTLRVFTDVNEYFRNAGVIKI